MMKKMMTLAMAAMMMIAVGASAQNNSTSGTSEPQKCEQSKECKKSDCKKDKDCKKKDCRNQDCKGGKECKKGEGKDGYTADFRKNPQHMGMRQLAEENSYDFTTLNLSADQLAKVNALNEAQKNARMNMRNQMAKEKKEGKIAKDSIKAEMREQKMIQREAARNRMQEQKREYLKGLRAILTDSQYVQFLEDNYMGAQGNQRHAGFGPQSDRKIKPAKGMRDNDGKPGKKGTPGRDGQKK